MASPEPIAEIKNKAAITLNIYLRPYLSPGIPINKAPKTQPKIAELTAHPFIPAVRLKCPLKNGNAPLITAVSKPNRNPPSAATNV